MVNAPATFNTRQMVGMEIQLTLPATVVLPLEICRAI